MSSLDLPKRKYLWAGTPRRRTSHFSISYLTCFPGLSLFWTAASARGLGLQHVSRFLSWGPANLCGLQARKGALRKGCDADIVFFDPDATFVVSSDMIRHKNKVRWYFVRNYYLLTYSFYHDVFLQVVYVLTNLRNKWSSYEFWDIPLWKKSYLPSKKGGG